MLGLDIYRMPFRLLLPDENGMYRTFLGSVLSILTLVMIITFGGFKTSQLVGMLDYKVQTHEMLEYLNPRTSLATKMVWYRCRRHRSLL